MARVQMTLTEYLRMWTTVLDKTDGKLSNYAPALKQIVDEVIVPEIERNFYSNKTPSGKPWKKLAPGTAKTRKVNKNNPLQILRDELTLFKSLNHEGNEYSVQKIGPRSLHFGTKDKKAIYHQKGTSRIPKRVFMPDNENPVPKFWLKKMAKILAAYKAQAIKARIQEKGR